MENPNTRSLYRYWNDLRAGRDAPNRSEIDPRRISGALETMFILEALDNGQMRFRLAGTRLCEWLGMEARGCVAEAVMARGHERELADLARRVLREPGVGVMRLRCEDESGVDWPGEALLLPLRSELGDLARVIGCVNLEAAEGRRRPRAPVRLRCLGARLLPIEVDPRLSRRDPERRFADPLGGADMTDAFAEPSRELQRPASGPQRPTLTAIEGNPSAPKDGGGEGGGPRRGRPNLRLIKG